MPKVTHILALLVAVAVLVGCGPVKTTMLIQDAEAKLNEAKELKADEKVASVYYYTAASEYLIKAKCTHGYSEFTASEDFALRARELADKAVAAAKSNSKPYVEPDPATIPDLTEKKVEEDESAEDVAEDAAEEQEAVDQQDAAQQEESEPTAPEEKPEPKQESETEQAPETEQGNE